MTFVHKIVMADEGAANSSVLKINQPEVAKISQVSAWVSGD
jgi:hypothetical protein